MKNFFKITAYFISFIALGAAAGYLVYKIIDFDKTGEVPQLAGKNITEASELLNTRKLLLSIEGRQYSDEIPEGFIISQKIEPEEKIKVGTDVGVTVSRGQETYSMPSFEGQLLEDVKLTVNNLGMKIKKVTWVHSDAVGEGKIIAQRPLSGDRKGNKVHFLVSLGQYKVSYRCPAFVNMTIDDARLLAYELGITLKERGKGSKVIFQKPEAGAVIQNGDSVEVKFGRGWGMWF
jgi:serine/threonine-protein kinase